MMRMWLKPTLVYRGNYSVIISCRECVMGGLPDEEPQSLILFLV